MKLSELLLPYKDCLEPFVVISESSLLHCIQDLAYYTEFPTSFVFSLEDNGIITGIHRHARASSSSGVGYSASVDNSKLVLDTSYVDKLTASLTSISEKYSPQVVDSPLLEILGFLVKEMTMEEVLQRVQFATSVFSLFGQMQAAGHANTADQNVLLKLLEFKNMFEDEYSLDRIIIPAATESLFHSSASSGVQVKTITTPHDSKDDHTLAAVTLVDTFRTHRYAHAGLFGAISQSAVSMSSALMRRMRIELSTLRSSLPESIRFMTLEDNYSFCKFLICGPVDTPYEGGFFLFDMVLPMDYPATSPAVTFLTTGGGQVRFNPNLYNCGKVCLSLLGTWSGEAW